MDKFHLTGDIKIPFSFHDEDINKIELDDNKLNIFFASGFSSITRENVQNIRLEFTDIDWYFSFADLSRPITRNSGINLWPQNVVDCQKLNAIRLTVPALIETLSPVGLETPFGLLANGSINWLGLYQDYHSVIIDAFWINNKTWFNVNIHLQTKEILITSAD